MNDTPPPLEIPESMARQVRDMLNRLLGDDGDPDAGDARNDRRPLATVPDMAEHYGVPEKTIRSWHQHGLYCGPLMFRAGKYLRARWDDIDDYDQQQAHAESHDTPEVDHA